jgi:hypothetical protein
MPCLIERSAAWTDRIAVVCLVLAIVGCEPSPIDPQGGVQPPPALPANSRQEILEGVPHAGLSARAVFYALGDTTSTISKGPSPFRFADVRDGSGIDFVHVSGMNAQKHYPTAFGSGVAMFDYDGDGRVDLYFATCNPLPSGPARPASNRLYRNLGGGKFRDATESARLGFAGFCHGIIAGDIDNDGDADVFLCNYGPNAIYLNNGDGTYKDISHFAGIDKPNWSSGGAMLDFDNDGDLDIYVANYGKWEYPRDAHHCGSDRIPVFCSPWDIRTVKHILFRNNGDRTFSDVTDLAGVGRCDGHGFGVVAADLNGDGRTDLYVANDMNPNFLFLNKGDGTFDDATETSGAAFDERGHAQSSMGVDAEDCDGDGRPELFVTNFQNEHIAYYQNLTGSVPVRSGGLSPAVFRESSAQAGLVADSRPWVGWGCALADFDNDGWPDSFVGNGHVDDNRKDLAPTLSYPEPPLLYRNVPPPGGARDDVPRSFQLSTRDVGPYFTTRHVARGAAFGDLDNDGDIDIVVNQMDGRPAILLNNTPSDNAWIRLKLVGTRSNRDAIGAIVEVDTGGRLITRQRKGGCSMQSTNDGRLLIGLDAVSKAVRVTVRWPSGAVSTLGGMTLKKTYEIVEPIHKDPKTAAVALPRIQVRSK